MAYGLKACSCDPLRITSLACTVSLFHVHVARFAGNDVRASAQIVYKKSLSILYFSLCTSHLGKSILQVPDTGTRVLDNTRPFLRSSIVNF